MIEFNKLAQGLSSSGAVSGFAGGLAGTALAGALTGRKGRNVAMSALKVGAVAAARFAGRESGDPGRGLAASLVAIDESRAEGRAYLRGLAAALERPEAPVNSVHEQVAAAARAEAA